MNFLRYIIGCLIAFCALLATAADTEAATDPESSAAASRSSQATVAATDPEPPWDFSPYRVLVWFSSDDPTVNAATIRGCLLAYLDRDFAAVWRTDIIDSPVPVATIAARDIRHLDYDLVTGADPVLAIKRNHQNAVRIRNAANVGQYCGTILAIQSRIDDVISRASEMGDATLEGVAPRLRAIEGDESTVAQQWADPQTEGLLVARGIAATLVEPEAKLITPKVSELTGGAFDVYDKIFVVHARHDHYLGAVDVVEIDTLMRHFGSVTTIRYASLDTIAAAVARGVTAAFAPVVRIENAGKQNATGLLRASGLILDETSPALVSIGDALEPMIRKNDRNGRPFAIGPIDWAVLLATEQQGRYLEMDYHSGRGVGLQGRKNKRTFRMALKARPQADATQLRLHLKGDPDFPLIGYELHEKELKSTKMTFVGRTDWNGRLRIDHGQRPIRLLYVKNGGAVLAKLPIIPGLRPTAVADLTGDDMRLQAEAYVRGVQNEITDLVAIRELYKARIGLHLKKGEMEKAEQLMSELRSQPNNEELSAAIGRKQIDFLAAVGKRNIGQRRKIDDMFTTTRELLSKFVTPKLIREVEADLIAARENGGRLPDDDPPPEGEAGEGDPAVEPTPTESPGDDPAAETVTSS